MDVFTLSARIGVTPKRAEVGVHGGGKSLTRAEVGLHGVGKSLTRAEVIENGAKMTPKF